MAVAKLGQPVRDVDKDVEHLEAVELVTLERSSVPVTPPQLRERKGNLFTRDSSVGRGASVASNSDVATVSNSLPWQG